MKKKKAPAKEENFMPAAREFIVDTHQPIEKYSIWKSIEKERDYYLYLASTLSSFVLCAPKRWVTILCNLHHALVMREN